MKFKNYLLFFTNDDFPPLFPGWGPAGLDPGRVKVMNKVKRVKSNVHWRENLKWANKLLAFQQSEML